MGLALAWGEWVMVVVVEVGSTPRDIACAAGRLQRGVCLHSSQLHCELRGPLLQRMKHRAVRLWFFIFFL